MFLILSAALKITRRRRYAERVAVNTQQRRLRLIAPSPFINRATVTKRRGSLFAAIFLAYAISILGIPAQAQHAAIQSNLAAHSLLLDAAQTSNLMVVVGERGHILRSNDDGLTWQQSEVPTRALLTGVYLHDDKLAWAVGHDATILRSEDGANTWQVVYHAPELESPLLDIWFKDESAGFAIGAYGLLLASNDGGLSWQQQWVNEDDDFHLNKIIAFNEQQLFIASEGGMLYRSDDLGETWQSLDSPYHGSFFGAGSLSNEKLIIFGLRGHLFLSEDQGESWQHIDTHTTAMLTTAHKNKHNSCYVAGLNGVVLINRQCDGRTFSLHQLDSRQAIMAILEKANGDLLLVGEAGITVFNHE